MSHERARSRTHPRHFAARAPALSVLFAALVPIALSSVGCKQSAPRWRYGPQRTTTTASETSSQTDFDPAAMERTMARLGCTACHTFHGETLIGPPLGGGLGDARRFVDGSTGTVDLDYLAESVLDPSRRVVEGFPAVMPSYAELLDEEEARAIAAYLASLR